MSFQQPHNQTSLEPLGRSDGVKCIWHLLLHFLSCCLSIRAMAHTSVACWGFRAACGMNDTVSSCVNTRGSTKRWGPTLILLIISAIEPSCLAKILLEHLHKAWAVTKTIYIWNLWNEHTCTFKEFYNLR